MAVIAVAGLTTTLTAEALSVPGTLGTASYSTDVLTFTCAISTTKVLLRVTDGRNPINSLATVYASFAPVNTGIPALTAADTDINTSPSPWIINATSSPGNYVLVVRKSASGMEDYAAEIQCQNSLGKVLGPSSTSKIHDQ